MAQRDKFYINGEWVAPVESGRTFPVVNPATEEVMYEIALGSAADVDRAVAAARAAWPAFAATTREERLALLERVMQVYRKRMKDIGRAISDEMGAAQPFAERIQAGAGLGQIMTVYDALKTYPFEERLKSAMITREPIGVAGMVTPWNWPLNQIGCKVAPALAAGCAMILKPSEYTPTSALIFAEVLDEAGVPPGVFNLVNGLGPDVGVALSSHPDIDTISFTGSTRAGIDVAIRAAPTVKRVSQELGGKSPNIILADADFEKAVTGGARHCFNNVGQSCNAPTRMLVPADRMKDAARIAAAVADGLKVGDPNEAGTDLGPVVNRTQWEKIQKLIEVGVEEGATLAAGGPGRPQGLNKGFFVRPTVFADVAPEMTISREEIFGPVLSIIPYASEDEAVKIANDTPYGLAGYVSSGDLNRARNVARQIRAGNVNINGAGNEQHAPFGGMKQSGNGREWGRFGIDEFIEVKAVSGWGFED
ncbi:aldehyde dehydrogenase family protein [Hyphomicrobium sp.]|uniref:aldehyde dehydrogenase family protein n=1 Tax=Hyphomicrobium sp. TaxID=82 RepID=UPI002C7A5A3B|nr:aldehyde dehydrogenase family protein [Hyphomicrobium sp.]HRN89628.1 aldehyde dehydrogenase family protein [Hyphomicrobium sp.]HRQ27559.1 aldehyde dehydrogenase family protein [Hyphomicrobium sp.]